ncbi:MAG: histidine phosphatase family protein [Thermodesulfovibrionales bacterium]|nr:histidine phosphatase family protein [Thermodesulfovibrionales bacterium]
MVKTLYLVRHGETGSEDKKRYKGSIDVPLSERGQEQINQAGIFIEKSINKSKSEQSLSYLAEIHGATFSANVETFIYSSSLIRAKKSAEIIARRLGVEPVTVSEFRERSFGIWEGLTFTEIKEKYPEEFSHWAKNPLRYGPPDGESTLDVKNRVIPKFKSILKTHKEGNIIIAAHGGVNRVILCHILGIPLKNIFRIEQGYGCVNIIEFWRDYPVVKTLNYV